MSTLGGTTTASRAELDHRASEGNGSRRRAASETRHSRAGGSALHPRGRQGRFTAGTCAAWRELRDQGKEQPAKLAEQAADGAERVGGYLKESDGERILGDVEDFGRRQPWAVISGGVAPGLVAARFLKASARRRYQRRPSGQPPGAPPAARRDRRPGRPAPPRDPAGRRPPRPAARPAAAASASDGRSRPATPATHARARDR